MKKKICFVVQRYGLEVNGGAELHCRQLAEHLLRSGKDYDISVLTSKAIDYMTWKDEYEGNEDINGIHVIRFSVTAPRKQAEFDSINGEFFEGRLSRAREREWIEKQGPAVPGQVQYLRDHKEDYDVFIFFTYLYYPTVLGVKEVADKAIVIPTAHDEPFLRMKIFDDVFKKPAGFFFNTDEERTLIHQKYGNQHILNDLGGVGVDLPETVCPERFKKKYGLDRYIIYVGRIDEGKNCHILFDFFQEYKKRNKNDLKLVLAGKAVIPVPKHPDIISIGFVEDEDKFDGIAGAELLVLPSEFESLSMVVLEAMSVNTAVLVNGKCPVLKGHCTKSNGALYYNGYYEFEGCINYFMSHEEIKSVMVQNAKRYVEENYQWDVIVRRLDTMITQVMDRNGDK